MSNRIRNEKRRKVLIKKLNINSVWTPVICRIYTDSGIYGDKFQKKEMMGILSYRYLQVAVAEEIAEEFPGYLKQEYVRQIGENAALRRIDYDL